MKFPASKAAKILSSASVQATKYLRLPKNAFSFILHQLHSFVRSFVRSFGRFFICLFCINFFRSFVRLFGRSFVRFFILCVLSTLAITIFLSKKTSLVFYLTGEVKNKQKSNFHHFLKISNHSRRKSD
jgi:hypothetical protein